MEREKRGKETRGWEPFGAKNRRCNCASGCSGAVVGAVLDTAKYGIVWWSPARDLAMLWVWLQFGGACVRSAAVEVNYRVTTQWRMMTPSPQDSLCSNNWGQVLCVGTVSLVSRVECRNKHVIVPKENVRSVSNYQVHLSCRW